MLQDKDPKLAQIITKEALRQENEIELIASENYVSKEVLEAN
jgi:glycine hydroxymethyltransferase